MDPRENPYASTSYTDAGDAPHGRPVLKPVSVTVFGVLHLVCGAPGLLFAPLTLVFAYFIESGQGPPNPVWDMMRKSPEYMLFYKTSIWVWFVVTIVLVAAGIGLLRGRTWGRTLSIVYGWFNILWSVVGFVGNYFLMLQPLSQLEAPGAAMGYIFGLVGGILGGIAGLIYPILVLIFMNRSVVVEYFRQQTKVARHG